MMAFPAQNQHQQNHIHHFQFAQEEEKLDKFQELIAEDLLHPHHSCMLNKNLPLILILLLVSSQHAKEKTLIFQKQTAQTEEHQFAMDQEQMELLEKDADHHFQCAIGPEQSPSMELWEFQELIAKHYHSQLVVQLPEAKLALIAKLEKQVHQSLLLKLKPKLKLNNNGEISYQPAQIDLPSTVNQFAQKVKPLDALRLELQLRSQ